LAAEGNATNGGRRERDQRSRLYEVVSTKDEENNMSRIEIILWQIESTRRYTASLLEAIEPADWFRQPPGGVTHVAWQVGHIAAAEYYLALARIRGRQQGDAELIPDAMLSLFGRGSQPSADPGRCPSVEEIRGAFDRVHQAALACVRGLADDVLDQKVDKPHPMFQTKGQALLFCSHHEMIHAGQIGLLRRLLGGKPLR
jgi:hypothetical protein